MCAHRWRPVRRGDLVPIYVCSTGTLYCCTRCDAIKEVRELLNEGQVSGTVAHYYVLLKPSLEFRRYRSLYNESKTPRLRSRVV